MKEILYQYRVKQSDRGPDEFGPCEVCGKSGHTNYILQKQKIGQIKNGLDSTCFGHRDCMEKVMEKAVISDELKAARVATGMSQSQAAEYTSVTLRTIKNWEQGVNSPAKFVAESYTRLLTLYPNRV